MKEGWISILLMVAAGAVVLLAIGFGISAYRGAQDQASGINTQVADKLTQTQELVYTQYDGEEISGLELVNLIKDTYAATNYVDIKVKTNAAAMTSYISGYVTGNVGPGAKNSALYANITNAEDKNNALYINPTGRFKGKLTRDANNTMVCLEFTQQ